jgi:hypothetical protein
MCHQAGLHVFKCCPGIVQAAAFLPLTTELPVRPCSSAVISGSAAKMAPRLHTALSAVDSKRFVSEATASVRAAYPALQRTHVECSFQETPATSGTVEVALGELEAAVACA